jgi:membrane protease YdiL (CAAX protease family)
MRRSYSGFARSEFISALVIFAIVALVVSLNFRATQKIQDENPLDEFVIKLLAQQAIGFKSFDAKLQDRAGVLLRQMDDHAHSRENEIRVAIVAGHLNSKYAALERLDSVSHKSDAARVEPDVAALRTIYNDGVSALPAADRDRLVQRYGYFGNTALSYGDTRDAASTKLVEDSAKRTLLVMGLVGLGAIGLFVVSVGLLITGIIFAVRGNTSRHYVPAPGGSAAFIEVFALYLFLYVLLGVLLRLFGLVSLSWYWTGWLILPIVMLWAAKRGHSLEDARRALGWYSGEGWIKEAALGIAGYLACIPFIGAAMIVTSLLMKASNTFPRSPIVDMMKDGNPLALYGIACVFAPVLEETMFRGALFHYFRGRWQWIASAPIVAFIFAIIHPQGWVALPVLGTIALVLAALREWRGSLIAPITAHALNNFIAITFAMLLFKYS